MADKTIIFEDPIRSRENKGGLTGELVVEDSLIISKIPEEGYIYNAGGTVPGLGLDFFRRVNRNEAGKLLRMGGVREIK